MSKRTMAYNRPVAEELKGASERADVLARLIDGRRSVRRYAQREVPVEVVRAALEAARWAPSPHNSQPWRFAILRTRGLRERFAARMGERWRADLAADGLPPAAIEALIGKSRERIRGASVVIIIGLTYADLDVYPDASRQEAERVMAAQSLGAAAQNIMLVAHAHGVASCWMCAPLFCPSVVREALDLPAEVVPQAMITLGYPAVQQPLRPRRRLDEFILLDA